MPPTTEPRHLHAVNGQRAAVPDDRCRCGQPAVIVFLVESGEDGYCGQPRGRRAARGDMLLFWLVVGVLAMTAIGTSVYVAVTGW